MPETLVQLLRESASERPGQTLFTFVASGEADDLTLTYGELDRQARAVAAFLQGQGAKSRNVLLLYPSGPDFIAAFFGCQYAGMVAVPAYPPRLNQNLSRVRTIAGDAGAEIALTDATTLLRLEPLLDEYSALKELRWLSTDAPGNGLEEQWREVAAKPTDLALLQYTSGSTAVPKGVMVSHRNVLYNSAYIHAGLDNTPESIGLSWLPHFHDMGLIYGIIQPLFIGFPCFLMSPAAFLQHPLRWLQTITRYGVTHTGGPNFAYDLCVRRVKEERRAGLDLRSWRVAYNGAEPVRRETLERFVEAFAPYGFRWNSFYPCYGLAEATLKVSGGRADEAPVFCDVRADALAQNRVVQAVAKDTDVRHLVGSGRAKLETEILIVDPATLRRSGPAEVGEVWVSGPSVADGYWQRPQESKHTFQAYLSDERGGPFLRTGDLGFFKDGELFITGRLKDLIIIDGLNHYPQDIELTVERSHRLLRPAGCAAFSIEADGHEQLVVVAELEPRYWIQRQRERTCDGADGENGVKTKWEQVPDVELIKTIRRAVAEEHEIRVYQVSLLKPGTIPKTSSGKIQRHACRAQYQAGALGILQD